MGKSIGIRVDLGSRVGSGHWVRMQTLADSLAQRGHQVTFFSRNHDPTIVPPPSAHPVVWLRSGMAAKTRGEQSRRSPPRLMHADFLPVPPEADLRDFAQAVEESRRPLDLLIVDHYGIDAAWERASRQFVPRIAVIDDLADRDHDTDLLLDQNYYRDMEKRYSTLIPAQARTLLGPSFAILRPAFEEARRGLVRRRLNAPPVAAIGFGGRDLKDYNHRVAKTLLESTSVNVVVMGTQDPANVEHWRTLRQNHGPRLRGPQYFKNPAEVFIAADFFVGAGGSTTWERFALGLPGIVYSIAENQKKMSEDASKDGYQIYLGDFADFECPALTEATARILTAGVHEPMIAKMMDLVDGLGASRVADALEELLSS